MIYLKSVFAGIIAIALSFFLLSIGVGIYLSMAANSQGSTVAWDPISLPGALLVILAVFLAGFLGEFRRASR